MNEVLGVSTSQDLLPIGAEVVVAGSNEVDAGFAVDLLRTGVLVYIEPNYIYRANLTPNDTSLSSLWGMHQANDIDINAPEAWGMTTGSNEVVVGVVDTGINQNHPDLVANLWSKSSEIAGNWIDDDGDGYTDDKYGWNGAASNGNANDDNAHGSHCAGTIGGVGNNGSGVAGVNWKVKMMALKFLGADGSGSSVGAINAINYAVKQKQLFDSGQGGVNVTILSNSWGGGGYSSALQSAIEAANQAGILFVVAAGNNSQNLDVSPSYPASYNVPNIVSVAAIDSSGNLASFSNYGAQTVHVGAPGVGILSTVLGTGYSSFSGTSMACPHVSGIAALIQAKWPGLTPATVKNLLVTGVKPLAALQGKTKTGAMVRADLPLGATLNLPPRLTAIPDLTLSPNAGTRTVQISAVDPEGDPITLSSTLSLPDPFLLNLNQTHGPWVAGSYNEDYYHLSEKWLLNTANQRYIILPNGNFHRVIAIVNGGILVDEIANVGEAVYANPTLLTSAKPPFTTNPTASLSGSTLTLGLPPDTGWFNVTVTATASGGSDSKTFKVTLQNGLPVLSTIPDQTMTRKSGSKTISLAATDADGDTLTYSGTVTRPGQLEYDLKVQYGFYLSRADAWYNYYGLQEKEFDTPSSGTFILFPDGTLYKYANGNFKAQYIATIARSYYDDPKTLVNAAAPSGPIPATLSVSGSQMTITPVAGFVGSFGVKAVVSDGIANTTQTFSVTVQDNPPTIATIPDQSMSPKSVSKTISVSAADADGDALTYSASILRPGELAYTLKQQYSFYLSRADGWYNYYGQQEKELESSAGTFVIFPDGNLYLYGAGNLKHKFIANLGAAYHANLNLLVNATAPTLPAQASTSWSGNQLTITPNAGFSGTLAITISVTDGGSTANTTFNLTLLNNAPTITAIPDQTMAPNAGSKTVNVAATDPDGDTLTYSASILRPGELAYNLKQQYGFYLSRADGWYNYYGQQEKELESSAGTFVIFPDGNLYQYGSGNLKHKFIGNVGTNCWSNLSALVSPPAPSGSPQGTVSWTGNQLRVTPNAGFSGSLSIDVSVSDGSLSAKTSFALSILNNAPTVTAIADQTMSPKAGSKTVTVSASDADGDALTYSASILRPGELAYNLKQQYGFYLSRADAWYNYYGQQEKEFDSASGTFVIFPDGNLYQYGSGNLKFKLIANIGTSYWSNPLTLVNAPAPSGSPQGTTSWSGTQLTVTPNNGFTGALTVIVSVTDGSATGKTTFALSVVNGAPVLGTIPDQTILAGASSKTVTLSASDSDGDALTYSATVLRPGELEYNLKQQYGFYLSRADGWYNYYGQQEKEIETSSSGTFVLFPDGKLYQYGSNNLKFKLIATIGTSYYANLSSLVNAQPPTAPPVATATVSGTQLTITPNNGYSGTFGVNASVSDGTVSATQTFFVTVSAGNQGGSSNDGGSSGGSPGPSNPGSSNPVPPVVNTTDTDGDGIFDVQEDLDGTDKLDPGSHHTHLQSPVHAMWINGAKISTSLLLRNNSTTTLPVTVTLFHQNGSVLKTEQLSLPGPSVSEKLLTGLPANGSGIVRLEYSGALEGSVVYSLVRPGASVATYVLKHDLDNDQLGASAVSFTNSIGLNRELQVANLTGAAKSFTVVAYNQSGKVLNTRTMNVQPHGSSVLAMTKAPFTASAQGHFEIVPADAKAPYLARMVFRQNSFIVPLRARAGNGRGMSLPVSRAFGEETVVNLTNTLGVAVDVELTYFNSANQPVRVEAVRVPRHSEKEILGSGKIPAKSAGRVSIVPSVRNSIVANSELYLWGANHTAVSAMMAVNALELIDGEWFDGWKAIVQKNPPAPNKPAAKKPPKKKR